MSQHKILVDRPSACVGWDAWGGMQSVALLLTLLGSVRWEAVKEVRTGQPELPRGPL